MLAATVGVVAATVPAYGIAVAAAAPALDLPKVTGLRATALTISSVTLAWDPSTYNEGDPENTYRVYEVAPDGQATLAAVAGHDTTATIVGLLPGSTHAFAATLLDSDLRESVLSAPLTVTTYAPPTLSHPDPDRIDARAAVGVPFVYQLVATGVPAPAFGIVSGPAGLGVDPVSGRVAWTPVAGQEGIAAVTARATNAFGQADLSFTFPVAAAGSDLTPPGIVTGVVASNPKRNGTDLTWDPATDNVGIDHYRLRVYSSDAAPVLLTRQDTTGDATSTTLLDPALTFNSTYWVKVTAVDAAGNESDFAATPRVPFTTASVDVTAPTAPGNVAAGSLTPTSAALSWSPSTDDVALGGYRVYRRTVIRSRFTTTIRYTLLVNDISPGATSVAVNGLASGVNYSLLVEAFDAAGNTARSPVVTFTTPAAPGLGTVAPPTIVAGQQVLNFYVPVTGVPAPATALAAGPDGMTATTPYAGSVLVHWEPQASLAAGDYPFTLVATNDVGTTQQSYVVHVLPFETDITHPETISAFRVDAATSTTADLSWAPATDNVGVDHYAVNFFAQVALRKQFNRTWMIPAGTGERVAANLTGLVAGKTYRVTVTTYDAAGNASFPLTTSVTTAQANVIDTYVSGAAWTTAFKTFLAAQPGQNAVSARGGFRVSDLGTASTPLPFVNLNVVGLRFNGTIPSAAVSAGLTVTSDGVALPVSFVGFDALDNRLALIRLARPVPTGMLRVQVAGVETLDGQEVDFSVPVRGGDVNGDGKVGALDLLLVRNRLGRSTLRPGAGSGAYLVAADVNGSGGINAVDLAAVRSLILNTPVAPPPAPSAALTTSSPAKRIAETLL